MPFLPRAPLDRAAFLCPDCVPLRARDESAVLRSSLLLRCRGGKESVFDKAGHSYSSLRIGALGRSQNVGDCGGQLFPSLGFLFQLLAAARGQLVELGAPVVLRCAPACLNPATALQPMQRRIKRALLDAQHIGRDLLDAFRNGPPVTRPERQGLQDEEIKRPLRQIDAVGSHAFPLYFDKSILSLLSKCKWKTELAW